jgi:hypothetical protein
MTLGRYHKGGSDTAVRANPGYDTTRTYNKRGGASIIRGAALWCRLTLIRICQAIRYGAGIIRESGTVVRANPDKGTIGHKIGRWYHTGERHGSAG